MSSTPPDAGSNAFRNVPSSCWLYVPEGSEVAYKTASGWSSLSSRTLPVSMWSRGTAYPITSATNATAQAGDGTVVYKWQRCQFLNGVCIMSDVSSATAASYTIPATTHSDGQVWRYQRCAKIQGCISDWTCTDYLQILFLND